MNPNELLNADHRVLSGLIGRVWSPETTGADNNIAKENAELFIRMYLKEKFDDHHLRGAAATGSEDPADQTSGQIRSCSPAADQLHHQYDDRDHQQDVDEVARHGSRKAKSQNP